MTPPTKPPTTTDNRLRVCRGGGWYSRVPSWVRALSRFAIAVSIRGDYLGFRCAQRGCCQPLKVTP